MKNHPAFPRCALLLLLGGLAGLAPTFAQTTPRPSAIPADDEVHKLDAFTVTAEIGTYAETDSSSATKTASSLRSLPTQVLVMNNAFLEDLRAERLGDVYQYMTGVSFNDTRTSDGFTIRGMEGSSNIKNLMVDGLAGLGARFSTPSTANIERVEVLKGPAAVLYGYMQPGGLVNMVTKKPQARRSTTLFASVRTYASGVSKFGDDNGYLVNLDSTGALSGDQRLRYRLIVEREDKALFRRNREQQNIYFMPSLMYAFSADTSLTVGLEYVRERKSADDGLVVPQNNIALVASFDTVYQDKQDKVDDDGLSLTAEFKHAFANGWKLSATARQVDHEDHSVLLRNSTITILTPLQNSRVNRRFRDSYNERNYKYLDATLQGDVQAGELTHKLLFGATLGWEQNVFDRRSFGASNDAAYRVNIWTPLTDTLGYPTPVPDILADSKIESLGFYAQGQLSLTPRLKAVVAARHDQLDETYRQERPVLTGSAAAKATVPSAGLVYEFSEQVSGYLSYAESFHPVSNSFSSEDINGVAGQWDPELGTQVELGLKVDLRPKALTLNAALFEISQKNVLQGTALLNSNGREYFVAIGGIKSRGGEIDLQYKPAPHIQVRAGYAYVDAFVEESRTVADLGAPQRNVAKHTANLWARYNVPTGALKGLGFGLGGAYQSERFGLTTNNAATQFVMPSYFKVDAAAYYNWGRYSFALNVKNLFDERYFPGGGSGSAAGNVRIAPGSPREMVFSVRTRF